MCVYVYVFLCVCVCIYYTIILIYNSINNILIDKRYIL